MELQKSSIDLGLRTNHLAPMLAFWQGGVGLPFSGILQIQPGQKQHRHNANGSVLKINAHQDALAAERPTGYRGLVIACEGLEAPRELVDPEGTQLELVPPGHDGVTQLGVRLAVRDLDIHRRFYAEALGLPEDQPGRFRAGESLILLSQSNDAQDDGQMYGAGFRYITFQVTDGVGTFKHVLAHGGRVGREPMVVNSPAVISVSMARDPDGNWIELLERP